MKIYKDWKRNRELNKVKEGDGKRMSPFHFWQVLSRTMFHIRLTDENGDSNIYSVTVNFFGDEKAIKLFKDGRNVAYSAAPASFEVPGGYIEVGVSTAGLSRMHYVSGNNAEVLTPNKGTAEHLRYVFDRKFPKTSKFIGILAVIVLLVSLVLGIPQLIEMATYMDIVKDNIGTFTSPIQLSTPVNTTLLIMGSLAAFERALTLKNHWLIDMEVTTFDM